MLGSEFLTQENISPTEPIMIQTKLQIKITVPFHAYTSIACLANPFSGLNQPDEA